MTLPFLLSVPHGGLTVPDEVLGLCSLREKEIVQDSDEGAALIYALQHEVAAFVDSEIARAIVDLNRAANDFSRDGVIKSHTCYEVPVYREAPSAELINTLLQRYYHPYHSRLTTLANAPHIRLGIDCHTMAAFGPPVGPDPGQQRPLFCLSNAAGTSCPDQWLQSLARCLHAIFPKEKIAINSPFRGGYIIRSHADTLPWLQIEVSRTDRISHTEKKEGLLAALRKWYQKGTP